MMAANPANIISDNEMVLVYVRSTLNANYKLIKKLLSETLHLQKFLDQYEIPDIVSRIPCGPNIIEETIEFRFHDPARRASK